MLMLDVRTAITKILDRYSLADIVEITLRKMRRDKVAPVFGMRPVNLHLLLEAASLERAAEPSQHRNERQTYAG